MERKTINNSSSENTTAFPPYPSPSAHVTPMPSPCGFSICKSKHKIRKQVIEPSMQNPDPAAKPPVPSPRNSTTTATTSDNSTDSTSTSSSFFSKSSISSKTSLSSLRESIILPDQPHLYDFREIVAATRNFSVKPHSSSSSSTSWRCTLRDQSAIIFQRKFRRPVDVAQLVEILSVICKSHHSSLVTLKGASVSAGGYVYLVYDYVAGASLSDCLRNARNSDFTVLSSWMSRIRIASDVAHGLDYVHNSTGLGFEFVHNRVKSSSVIVVEGTLGAKICHFGTSELCGEVVRGGDEGVRDVKFEGMRGYMSPEFQRSGVATQKCDVYAFGVVVLELLSGMEALSYRIDESGGYVRVSVVEAARAAVEGGGGGGGGGIRGWVDRRLRDSYPIEVAERLTRLALDCVADDPKTRPDMRKVVGRISQMFLESQRWSEKMGVVTDFTVSLAPR